MHPVVPAPLRNHRPGIRHADKRIIRIVTVQAFVQGDRSRKERYSGLSRPEEEPGRVQRLRIEERKQRIQPLFQVSISGGVHHPVDKKKAMKPWTRGLPVLLQQMMARIMKPRRHIRQQPHDDLRRHPLGRILRMIVIAVQRQAVRGKKPGIRTVPALILRCHIIPRNGGGEGFGIPHLHRVRIQAVLRVPDTVCPIEMKGRHFSRPPHSAPPVRRSSSAALP